MKKTEAPIKFLMEASKALDLNEDEKFLCSFLYRKREWENDNEQIKTDMKSVVNGDYGKVKDSDKKIFKRYLKDKKYQKQIEEDYIKFSQEVEKIMDRDISYIM